MTDETTWRRFFPFETPRPEQTQAINAILDAFINDTHKLICLDAQTGVGKSAIAVTIARWLNDINNVGISVPLYSDKNLGAKELADKKPDFEPGSYILTTQKTLQQQYIDDYGDDGMKTIKASTNYTCKYYPNQSCAESLRMLKSADKASTFYKLCTTNCCYRRAKQEFIDSPIGVTNFPYFLAETYYSGKLRPRELLVIDECHNIQNQLSSFIEVSVSEHWAETMLKLDVPSDMHTAKQTIKWLKSAYIPKLKEHIQHIDMMFMKFAGLQEKLNELSNFAKTYELMDKHLCKLNRFLDLYDEDNWVYNVIPPDSDRSGRRFEFKPVDVSPYSHDVLFKNGRRVLMMSATVLDRDAFCSSIGLDPKDVLYIDIPSPFPIENRPVFYVPMGNMGMKTIEQSLPNVASAVKEILAHHAKEKGIIHANSYKVAHYLKSALRDKRIIIHNSENREEMYKKHIESKKPTVLLSPSMTEGIDLYDDRARFQIIVKIPFPYLGDKVTQKRMHKDQNWYPYETAKTIVQALGRSIRNMDDTAVSYILDSCWEGFYRKNRRFFPSDFDKLLK